MFRLPLCDQFRCTIMSKIQAGVCLNASDSNNDLLSVQDNYKKTSNFYNNIE